LRELTRIDKVQARILEEELALGMTPSTVKELENNRPKKRISDLITTIASESKSTPPGTKRFVDIRFLLNPIEAVSDPQDPNHICALSVERTKLVGEPNAQKATKSDSGEEPFHLPCDLLLKSVGYKSEAIAPELPMNDRQHTLKHDKGKVLNHESLYVVGWLKRGPSGIIGTNIVDAKETVATMISQLPQQTKLSQDPVATLQQQYPFLSEAITWDGVQKLDAYEVKLGEASQPPKIREKLLDTAEMIRISRA
jgi:adrenodoxin-NADP+ reductase